MKLKSSVCLIMLFTLLQASSALAWDSSRIGIDPSVDLQSLRGQKEAFQPHVSTQDGVYEVDISAVFQGVDRAKLLAASMDYEGYARMGVREVKKARIFRHDPLVVWMSTRAAGQLSENYLEVRVLNSLTIPQAQAILWQQVSAEADWPYADDSAFSTLDGSWFVQDLENDELYVRYFMKATLALRIPDFLIRGIAQQELQGAAMDVMEVLAHQATIRR